MFIRKLGIPVPESWLYRYNQGWVLNTKPPTDEKVILKLNYETSSIGLDKNNIFNYDESKNHLIDLISQKYKQDVIIQKFIYGYEVEVSFIHGKGSFVFPPVGIKLDDNKTLGDKILDYDIRKTTRMSFMISGKNAQKLHQKSKNAPNILLQRSIYLD